MNYSLFRQAHVRVNYYVNSFLCWYFGFDKWHRSPYIGRPYAQGITKYLNQRSKRNSVVEVGCGLGGIIRNTYYDHKTGLDIDRNAIKAAKFLAGIYGKKNIRFDYFNFPEYRLQGSFDAIIMVNWIHNIPPDILIENMQRYFLHNLNENGVMIIDTVQSERYRYHHDVAFLCSGLNCRVEKVCDDRRVGREVFAILKA